MPWLSTIAANCLAARAECSITTPPCLSATASAQEVMATPAVGKPTPKVEQAATPAKMEKAAGATTAKATVKKHKKHRHHKKAAKKTS